MDVRDVAPEERPKLVRDELTASQELLDVGDLKGILVLDFGSQYSHLIVRRCREAKVYSELHRCDASLSLVREFRPAGIVLSGGPASVYDEGSPHVTEGFWDFVVSEKVPVLGICYGMQEMMHALGGMVERASQREYGHATLQLLRHKVKGKTDQCEGVAVDPLFNGLADPTTVWMSHGDRVTSLAPGFSAIASSDNSPYAAVADSTRALWGLQFHPEVTHSEGGAQMLRNFVVDICGCAQNWDMATFASVEVERIRALVGSRHVVGALSGGVDSTVAALLLYKAIGPRFHGFMVDTGLLRKDEGSQVLETLKELLPGLHLELIDGAAAFFEALRGITEPEQKRRIIGRLFIEHFETAVLRIKGEAKCEDMLLLQGTLYPDVIESISFRGPSAVIKTHHNVGGLPARMKMEVLEPLRELFKDEVRQLGVQLGLRKALVWRHPFPGPGLAIRIIGEVTRGRVAALREADDIYLQELRKSGDYEQIAQAFAVLLPESKSVGVMGDCRTYEWTLVLRAVASKDYMTADWYRMPYDVLAKCSTRIINEVPKINRVCYDVSSKPPATIEWE